MANPSRRPSASLRSSEEHASRVAQFRERVKALTDGAYDATVGRIVGADPIVIQQAIDDLVAAEAEPHADPVAVQDADPAPIADAPSAAPQTE